VDEDVLDFVLARHAQQREEMIDVRMDAAVADEAQQVQLARTAALHGFEKQRLAEEFAAGDEPIDARDVHLNDAAGAHIEVADLAIAHLPFGQADVRARSVNQGIREFLEQAVVIGFAGKRDGVALRLSAVAPAVEDGENDGFGALGHGQKAPNPSDG